MYKANGNINQTIYFPKHLTESFNKIFDYPLTVVVAPMGYGKTTAVRENIIHANANILWQSIFDDSKTMFWNGSCRLFIELDRECSNNLIQLGFPEDSGSLHIVLTLIEKLALRKQTIIVLDDFHLVETPEIVNFITFLVANEIMNLNIVIISRFLNFLKIEELLLKGYLLYIKKENFEFNKTEIMTYYKLCDITLTNYEANKLYNLTEGWITALYFLMINFKKTGKLLLSMEIYKLIEQVGYEPFSDESKKFILSMSIYDCFTKEMAMFTNPNVEIDKIINEITLQNNFIVYNPIQKLYCIHAIFSNFLSNKLELMPKTFREGLYKKACQWYMQKNEYILAMKYAYIGRDFDILLQALASDKGKDINGEHRTVLIKYYEACTLESKKNNLFAVLMYARHMFTFNEIFLFKKTCDEFMTMINTSEFSDSVYKNMLLAEYDLLLSLTEYNDIDKMMIHVKRASELLKDTSAIFTDSSPYTFGSPSILYLYYRQSGCLLKQVNTLREALPLYCKISGNQGKGADEIMSAEYCYYTGDFQNSEIHMHRAYQKITTETSGVLLCAIFLNIKLSFIKGDFDDILKLFKKLRNAYELKQYVFVQTIDLCEAYIFWLLNISEKVQPWIKNGEFENTCIFAPALGFINIVYAKFLFKNGEYLKLIGMSEQFLNTASIYPNILGQIYIYIFLAKANRQVYRYNEAFIALNQALNLAMPDKVYMPFVENYDYIKHVLEELYNHNVYQDDILKIIEIYKIFNKSKEKMINGYFPENKPTLTPREKQIALLASQGLSNKEISKQLYVSENTVKTQLKSIYVKLDINSRSLLKQNL